MRKFKNTILFILALLPILSFILTLGFAIGGNFVEPDLIIGELITSPCAIVEDAGGLYSVVPFDTFSIMDTALLRSSGCLPVFSTGEFFNQRLVLGTLHLMQEANVCVITTPMVFMGYYFVYMFVLIMIDLIFNLVTFVPRKCSEFLIGGMSL